MPQKAVQQIDQAIAGKDSRSFACPGLFRIVPSKDGGICRIKLALGCLTSAQARTVAAIAEDVKAGAIEATNRANLQIRGIPAGSEDRVIAALRAADLGGASAGADDIRNVMVNPLAGDDPDQVLDARGPAGALLAALERDARYHLLSPKFALLVDGGEDAAMLAHPNDIWLAAVDSGTFAFGFAGCPPTGDTGDHAAGFVAARDAVALVLACLDLFLNHRGKSNGKGEEITRFRHLLADLPAAKIVAALPITVRRDRVTEAWRRKPAREQSPIGILTQRDGRRAVGAAAPLGRLSPAQLLGVADLADVHTGGAIRLTPWQSLLLPSVAAETADTVLASLGRLGLVTDAAAPLAAMIACAGNTGCASGLADVKADALHLAGLLAERQVPVSGLHLTGCAKSCAAPRPASITLLALAPGRYDVFRRESGAAGKFGACLGADKDINQVAGLLADPSLRTQGRN
ncbi:precorrin-3B synthase [Dongia mobilis]|uniref:Precorrin-3B synthase n=1 Tax=Dongia mobilis TaxID=578943 RepID=A0A4R6X281_9PROT|nr:precorrin-3B synthase [Dongia mobilis]TDQ84588.1 precorrin-3B synthase [Dongia mobilis]